MMLIFHSLRQLLSSLVRLFFPLRCPLCGALLRHGEEMLCLRCELDLPVTGFASRRGNPAEQLLLSKVPIVRGTSFFYYTKGDKYRDLILLLKYKERQDIGRWLGRMAGDMLLKEGFFEGIDLLVPVPLHPNRQKQRGYNQSLCIAQGIAEATGIPIDAHSLYRSVRTQTQTRKQRAERWETMRNVFSVNPEAQIKGKHLLLIDDILTTGATLTACAEAILQTSHVPQSGDSMQSDMPRISIFTLGFAQHG